MDSRTEMKYMLSFLLLWTAIVVVAIAAPTSPSFIVDVGKDGSFSISVTGQPWLRNAPSFVSAHGKMYSTADGSLKLQKTVSESGWDKLGQWQVTAMYYTLQGTNSDTVKLMIKRYSAHPSMVLFGQHFLTKLDTTSTKDANKVVSGFPSFHTSSSNATLGFLAYGGIMVGDTGKSFGIWGRDNSNIQSGLDSGPLVLFNQASDAMVISPFSNFMAASVAYDNQQGTASWGIMGNATVIPEDLVLWTVVYYSGLGIHMAIRDWGETLRTYYDKPSTFMSTDFTINYLGYWTDNGGYYYYETEPGKTYEETIFDVKSYAVKSKIPYRYVQYDSWWYPKGKYGGVEEWVSMPIVFPDGMQYIWNQTGWMSSAHNRFWSPQTKYARANGGKYDFIIEPERSIPIDDNFWPDFLKESRKWGLLTYEQDWLNKEFNTMNVTLADVTIGRRWLRQMGEGAATNGLTIQYCMSPSRAALQSVEIPVVTQARASDDYQPGNSQWKIGVSSHFAHAIGLAPFKDNFWTTKDQPDNKYRRTEDAPMLQSVVATLSTGPVGPSDKNGYSNVSLIMRSCNAEGLILKPSRPARAVNAQIQRAAFGNSFPGPDGEVWTTYSDIAGLRFGIILAAELSNTYDIGPKEAAFENNFPKSKVFPYNPSSLAAMPFDDNNKLTLKNCGKNDFCLYHTTPVLMMGDKEVLIYGELDKWVPMSPQRVSNIIVASDDVQLTIKGVPLETTHFTFSVDGKNLTLSCYMNHYGSMTLSVGRNTCW